MKEKGIWPGADVLPWRVVSVGRISFELEVNGDCLNVSSEKKGLYEKIRCLFVNTIAFNKRSKYYFWP